MSCWGCLAGRLVPSWPHGLIGAWPWSICAHDRYAARERVRATPDDDLHAVSCVPAGCIGGVSQYTGGDPGRGRPGSRCAARVVKRFLPRTTPCSPHSRISRYTVHRATSQPDCRSRCHIFRTPYPPPGSPYAARQSSAPAPRRACSAPTPVGSSTRIRPTKRSPSLPRSRSGTWARLHMSRRAHRCR